MFRPGIFPQEIPFLIRFVIFLVLSVIIRIKFLVDSRVLPLQDYDWPLYLDIHVVSALRLRRLPNLRNPIGFNDQMKWLMLFGQHELMPRCADKYEVRQYVSKTIGESYLVPLRSVGYKWSDVAPTVAKAEGVVKCSHDSGSAYLFKEAGTEELSVLEEKFEQLLRKDYGVGKGEWYYGYYTPRIIVEERLWSPDGETSPTDIKVHCVDGVPQLVHLIDGRQTSVERQGFFLPDGRPTVVSVKPHRDGLLPSHELPPFAEIMPLVAALAAPFRYVRVDLYFVDGRLYFGELSFNEQAGLFQSRDEELSLGEALHIPCSNPSPTLNTRIPKQTRKILAPRGASHEETTE